MDKIIEAALKLIPFAAALGYWGVSEKDTISGLTALLVALLLYLISPYIKRAEENYKAGKIAKDLAPYFDHQKVEQSIRFYIPTRFQNHSPTVEEEPGFSHKFVVKGKLIPWFLKTGFNEKKETDKFYLILADSGMGKTTFMINLFIRYNSPFNFNRKYKMKLLPFGDNRIMDLLREMAKKQEEVKNTILLLDAFDEYQGLLPPETPDGLTDDERFRKRLDEIVALTRDFREVVITSRTQYFPGQENQAYELNIPRFDDKGFHTLAKLYLSPFDGTEIKQYLNKKYGLLKFWNWKKKRIAAKIVESSPKLMVRPMLLSYIDLLVEDGTKNFANTYQIYETLIGKWIEREANKRKHETSSREKFKQDLHTFSSLIAFEIDAQRKHSGNMSVAKEVAFKICEHHKINLRDYEITGQSLLTRDANHTWKFSHKSILEFMLAKAAFENTDIALDLDLTGLDMTALFCSEIGLSSLVSSNYKLIKGGEFLMGSPETEVDRQAEETQHPVELSDYYICKYAVTVTDFKIFLEATGYKTDAEKGGGSNIWDGKKWVLKEGVNWRFGVSGKERPESEYNHPVIHVSWNDAVAYCAWLDERYGKLKQGTFRLPTEAEWEYACRAGTTTPFFTGENLTTDEANYDGNYPYNKNKKGIYRKNTVKVDAFQSNAFGLHNMHGNVWEWCSDWYDEKFYDECKSQGRVENPTGTENGSYRVVRGGGWAGYAQVCRAADRTADSPDYRNTFLGFRLVFVP